MLRYIKNKKIKKWWTTKTGRKRCYIDGRGEAWKKWRESVYKRDGRICVLCGRKNKRMAPHHILPKKHHKELKYRVSNGATLCWRCHKKTFYKEHEWVDRIVKATFGSMKKWYYNNYWKEVKKLLPG